VTLDMGTLALAVGISMAIRLAATTVQYTINRDYRGIGLWAVASACAAAGFAFLFFRTSGPVPPGAIVAQNGLIVLAVLLEYLGTMAFLGRPAHRRVALVGFAAYMIALAVLTFVTDAIDARTTVIHAAVSTLTLLTAWNLWADRRAAIRLSTRFLSVVFALSGLFYAMRAMTLMFGLSAESMITPSAMQVVGLVVVLVEGNLLTYGLIIMVGQRLHAEASESKDRFKLLFNTSPDAAVISRLTDGVIASVNDGFSSTFGYTRDEAMGESTLDLLWDDPAGRATLVASLRETGSVDDFEAVFKRKDGSRFVGMVSSKNFEFEGGAHIISVIRDITERKSLEDELKVRATTDVLTGVANRAKFLDVASLELDRARRHGHPLSIALLDIDDFKRVNDSSGHLAGDAVLVGLADVAGATIRSIDSLARFGGDEFVVLMPETGTGGAAEVAERIRGAVEAAPWPSGEPGLSITVCLGVATLHEDEDSLDLVLRRADQALYRAKEAGRNRVVSEEAGA